jgi:hypothetical protein
MTCPVDIGGRVIVKLIGNRQQFGFNRFDIIRINFQDARAPFFLRGMVRRLAERRARAEGVAVITPELMTRYKSEMMGLAESGAYTVPPSAPPWTPDALALLDAVPAFMRPMTRRICEELAAEPARRGRR